MSIKTPRKNKEGDPGSALRRAVRCLLASSILFMAPDTAINTKMPQEENYDYLFEGVKILPEGSPKIPRGESDREEEGEGSHDADSEDLFCTPETCQFG